MFDNPYEGGNIFVSFEKLHPMTGEEISEDMACTRQNVSRILKDVMEKFYNKVKFIHRDKTPFEIATVMMEMLGVNQRNENEILKFHTLYPLALRNEIEEDGKRILDKYRKHK
jgi:prolyl-tRNA synthetase